MMGNHKLLELKEVQNDNFKDIEEVSLLLAIASLRGHLSCVNFLLLADPIAFQSHIDMKVIFSMRSNRVDNIFIRLF